MLVRYLLLAVSGIILVVSLSPALQHEIASNGWIPDQYRFGDLYNTSNLPEFKELDYSRNNVLLPADKPKEKFRNVDLYTIGDSFTPMDTSYYAGDKNFHIWMGVNVDTVKLDPVKKSILVIEVIERTIQERLIGDYKSLYIDKGFQVNKKPVNVVRAQQESGSSFWWDKFGDQINQRIEFLLFNSNPFLEFKELKASIMWHWFGRTHTGVMISKNHKYMFYDLEADKRSVLSSFYNIKPESITEVVKNINAIRDSYKRVGFAEVYFCLIPTKTTVCENDRFEYNQQITRIQTHPLLKTPMISVKHILRNHPEWYHKGDGHWNVTGKRFWLSTVNKLVEEWNEKSVFVKRNK